MRTKGTIMRIEEIDKIRFQNIEMENISAKHKIPEYLTNWFCFSLSHHVMNYVEEKREKEKTNNQEVNNV